MSELVENNNGQYNFRCFCGVIVMISVSFTLVIQSWTYVSRKSVTFINPLSPVTKNSRHLCPARVDNKTLHDTLTYLVKDLQTSEHLSRTQNGTPTHGIKFLENYLNPCWLEELPAENFTYPHTKWLTMITDRMVAQVHREMMPILKRRQTKSTAAFPHGWRMRCLPYVYIIGIHMAGTTDLYRSIAAHPHVAVPPRKEAHFWSRLPAENGISKYLDFYDVVSETIRRHVTNGSGYHGYHGMVTLDGSPHTYESYYRQWWRHPWNDAGRQCITLPQHLTHITPQSKYLLILRSPERWIVSCVNFMYHQMAPLGSYSSQSLHADIAAQIQRMDECIGDTGDALYCTYKMAGTNRCNLAHMMYYVWVKLWVDTVGEHRIVVINADVYFRDRMQILGKVFSFIGLPPVSESLARKINGTKPTNKAKRKKVELLPQTRLILLDFLAPWNKKLANFLSDKTWLWQGNT